jgi:integrase
MNGSIKRYCACKDDAGKVLGSKCPQLAADSKHGQWELRDRLPSSKGKRPFRRRSMPTKTAATAFRKDVYALLDLARGDRQSLAKLGDLVFASTNRGGQLPDVADVRRRLGLGVALDRSQTVEEWLTFWLANKKRSKRESTSDSYADHVRVYLIPILGDIALDRLTDAAISDMFDLIEERNIEIRAARDEGRRPVLDDKDIRARKKTVGATTQQRIFATLRNAMNAAFKARRIDVNPCDFVELAPEDRYDALTWSPEQVHTFLEASADDALYLLYRLVLLAGLRRGEVTGLRWADLDLDERELVVSRPLLAVRGKTVEGSPKSRAGERAVSFDSETAALLRKHRTKQKRDRLAWGEAYEDNDMVFARADGTAVRPDQVSRHFQELIARTDLPRIKLHEGRHTAATLLLEAKVDIKIVSAHMGHSTTNITQNLYQHVRRAVARDAVESVLNLLPSTGDRDTGQAQ